MAETNCKVLNFLRPAIGLDLTSHTIRSCSVCVCVYITLPCLVVYCQPHLKTCALGSRPTFHTDRMLKQLTVARLVFTAAQSGSTIQDMPQSLNREELRRALDSHMIDDIKLDDTKV